MTSQKTALTPGALGICRNLPGPLALTVVAWMGRAEGAAGWAATRPNPNPWYFWEPHAQGLWKVGGPASAPLSTTGRKPRPAKCLALSVRTAALASLVLLWEGAAAALARGRQPHTLSPVSRPDGCVPSRTHSSLATQDSCPCHSYGCQSPERQISPFCAHSESRPVASPQLWSRSCRVRPGGTVWGTR